MRSYYLRFVVMIPFLVAAVCLLAILPWILAAPMKNNSDYSLGWNIGIGSLLLYPILIIVTLLVVGWYHRLNLKTARTIWGRRTIWIMLALFAGAQIVSWSLLLK